MKKQLIAAGVAATIGIAGLGAGVASAETNDNKPDHMSSLIDKLSSKFNLDKNEVQKVFSEQRSTMEAERDQRVEDELAQLVKDGKLTQAQADLINSKRAELQKEREDNRENMREKSDEERKAAKETRKTELENWAKENGIDTQYLKYIAGHGRGAHGPRH